MIYAIREVASFAMNKGGTMESLFHPYAKGFILRAVKKAFLFFPSCKQKKLIREENIK